MEIVKMTYDHTPAVAEIEKQCFSKPWSKQALDDTVENPGAVFLVAMENGLIAGYGGMHFVLGEFYIDNIAVDKSKRNKGIGTAIIEALENCARKKGGEFITLEVRTSNKAANLYKRLGFEQEGLRRGFYQNPKEDGLILTKRF